MLGTDDSATPAAVTPTPPGRRAATSAAAVLITFLVFLPSIHNGWTNWDDTEVLLRNPHWRGFAAENLAWMATGTRMGHYQPLTWVSYALDHALWGVNSAGIHLGSLVLHALSAGLLVAVLARLLRRMRVPGTDGDSWPLALACLAGALMWSLHPLRVEPVAWATGRRDVLSALFLLAASFAWLGGAWPDGGPAPRQRRLATAWFLAAVLAKGQAFVFPVLLLVMDFLAVRRRRDGEGVPAFAARMLLEKTPMFAIALASAVVSAAASRGSGAMLSLATHDVTGRIVQAGYGIAFYLGRTLAPFDLSPLYPLPVPFVPFDAAATGHLVPALLGWTVALAVFVAAGRRPAIAAAGAFALVAVAPVLGFAQSGPQIAADRYTHVAAWALSAAVAAGVLRLAARLRARPETARPLVALAGSAVVGALAICAVLSVRQIAVWRDSLSLWSHAVALHPRSALALNNRGQALEAAGHTLAAMEDYSAAVAADPRLATPLASRGTLLAQTGDAEGARADFEAALARNPGHVESLNGLGNLDLAAGRPESALARYEEALRLRPDYADAWYNLGALRLGNGDPAGARAALETAARLRPDHAMTWHNLGIALQKLGDRDAARDAYRKALDLDPSLAALFEKKP
jgi:Tfp pilus assembly protein PilF